MKTTRHLLCWVSLVACLLWCTSSLRAQAVIHRGVSGPSGTLYSWTWMQGAGLKGASVQLNSKVGAVDHWSTLNTQGGGVDSPESAMAAFSWSGSFTVPVGQTWYLYKNTLANGPPNSSSWASELFLPEEGGELTGNIGGDKQISFKLPSTGPFPITWQLFEVASGDVVSRYEKAAYTDEYVWTIPNLPSDAERSDYELSFFMKSLKFDTGGGHWIKVTDPGDGTAGDATVFESTVPDSGTGAGTIVDEGATPTAPQIGQVPKPEQGPATEPKKTGTGGAVWAGISSGAGLTDTVFKEGVDRLIDADANGHLKTLANGYSQAQSDGAAARKKGYGGGSGGGAGSGEQAKSDLASAYGLGSGSVSTVAGPPSGSSTGFSLTTSIFGTVNFDPAEHPTVVLVMAWMKAVTAWVLTLLWAHWLFKHFRELTSVGAVPQLRGHDIAMGAGGQATALGNAVIWTTIMLAIPVAFTAALNTAGLTMPSIASLTASPMAALSGMGPSGAMAAQLIGYLVPWDTLVLCLVGPPLVSAFSIPIYMGVQAAIRWLIA